MLITFPPVMFAQVKSFILKISLLHWLLDLHFNKFKRLFRLRLRLRFSRLVLLRHSDSGLTRNHLLGLLQLRLFFFKQCLHRFSFLIKISACSTGCSACTSASASACSACSTGYSLAGTYCCATATPYLQAAACQASCNTGYFSLSSVCTGKLIIITSSLFHRVFHLHLNKRQHLHSVFVRIFFGWELLLPNGNPGFAGGHLSSLLQQRLFFFKQRLHW